MELKNKKILMVLSHCDDEIICGWPIFQDKSIKKKIIIVSSDLNNKNRIWCSFRKFVFREVCKNYNITENFCLDFDSEFSQKKKMFNDLKKKLVNIIDQIKFDLIFTHNSYGEYQNADHISLYKFIKKNYKEKMIITNICYDNTTPHYGNKYNVSKKIFDTNDYKKKIITVERDQLVYDNIAQYYKFSNVWTWNDDIVNTCAIYKI